MNWLLKLYPREWRRRYGAEVEEIVAAQPKRLQLVVDLLGGAVDAHLKPQAFAQRMESATNTEGGGSDMVHRLRGCCTNGRLTRREALISGALSIVGSLGVAALLMVSEDPMVEAVAVTMMPGIWLLATQPFFLRGHSARAKVALIGGPLLVLLVIGVLAGLAQGA